MQEQKDVKGYEVGIKLHIGTIILPKSADL